MFRPKIGRKVKMAIRNRGVRYWNRKLIWFRHGLGAWNRKKMRKSGSQTEFYNFIILRFFFGGVGPEKMSQKQVSGSVSPQNRPKSQNGKTKSGRSVLKSKIDQFSAQTRGVKPKKNEKIRKSDFFRGYLIGGYLIPPGFTNVISPLCLLMIPKQTRANGAYTQH